MARTVTSCMLAMLRCVTSTRAHHSMAGEYDATRQLTVAGDKLYFIDLHRIRGGIVDLSVHQRKK